MTKTVEIIFDVVSPNAYLAWYPLKAIAEKHGAELIVTPVFLGGMHKLTGNAPPFIRDAEVKGKNQYAMLEMNRFIKKHGMTSFKMPSNFPFNSIMIQRLIAGADNATRIAIIETLLPAIFENGVDATDPEAIGEALTAAGHDGAALMANVQDEDVKAHLVENTSNAVERGTFGIPTFYVDTGYGEEMYFGKERLGQIEEQLAG